MKGMEEGEAGLRSWTGLYVKLVIGLIREGRVSSEGSASLKEATFSKDTGSLLFLWEFQHI